MTNNDSTNKLGLVDYKDAISRFPGGLAIVTAQDSSGTLSGLTCQCFNSLSLDPPLVAFFVSKGSKTFPKLKEASQVCFNVLAHDQDGLARQFSISDTDRWDGVRWHTGANTAPRIAGSLLWCEATLNTLYDGGDHHIVTATPTTIEVNPEAVDPLIFYKRAFYALSLTTN